MRRRLILGAVYLLIIVVVGLSVPFAVTLERRLTSELGGRVEAEAFTVGANVEDLLEAPGHPGLQSYAVRVAGRIGGRVLVTDGAGVLLADSLQPPGARPPSYASRPEIASALAGVPIWEVRHSDTLNEDLLVSAVPVEHGGGVIGAVRISYPMAEVAAAAHRARLFLAAIGAVTLLIGLVFAWLLARWVTRPLAETARVARRIADGDLEARAPVVGPPEVREVAGDLNVMTDRLADLVRANREFAANASHQLRTPLTALQLSLEEALAGDDPRGEVEHALAETARLGRIVDALLALGRPTRSPAIGVSAGEAAGAVAAAVRRRRPGLEVDVTGDETVLADPERLREVLGNLVDNAGRFARSRVVVSVRREGDGFRISVEDDGPGIPEEERARVFDRFARGRVPGGSGAGLGLAVARELAAADGATISLDDTPLGGACFVVRYPLGHDAGSPRPDGAGSPAGTAPVVRAHGGAIGGTSRE